MSGQFHAPASLPPGGRVGPTAGLDDVAERKFLTLTGLELQLLDRPARSQSLYRLRYHIFHENKVTKILQYLSVQSINV
jgi:hypothetical protein